MKAEIEVELPDCVAKEYEVVRIGTPTAEDVVMAYGRVTKFDSRYHDLGPRIILRRKDNPCDWWPKWITADWMMLQADGCVCLTTKDGRYVIHEQHGLLDTTWIPEHLKRSGRTFENPWKANVQ